jgi:hypothetical protein
MGIFGGDLNPPTQTSSTAEGRKNLNKSTGWRKKTRFADIFFFKGSVGFRSQRTKVAFQPAASTCGVVRSRFIQAILAGFLKWQKGYAKMHYLCKKMS